MHHVVRRSAPAWAALLALGMLSACGDDTGDASATDDATSETPSPTETSPTSEPTDEPTADESDDDGDDDDVSDDDETDSPRPKGLQGRLLTAAEFPGYNDDYAWSEDATSNNEGQPLSGGCHKFAMTSIGAFKVARRTFTPAADDPGSSASELVAQFADDETARKAYATVTAWHDQCAQTLGPAVDIGDLQQADVDDADDSVWYLITGDDGFEAQGYVRVGDRMAVITMALAGQDYNYEPGEEPIVEALDEAADLLE